MTDEERTAAVHDIIEDAADELVALGLEGVAPWRAMAWIAMDNLRAETCAACGRADLTRLQAIIAKHLEELGPVEH